MSVGSNRRVHQKRRELEIDGIDKIDMRQRRIGYRDDRYPCRSPGKPSKAPVHLAILHRFKTSFEPIRLLTLLPHGIICHAGASGCAGSRIGSDSAPNLCLRLGATRRDARSCERDGKPSPPNRLQGTPHDSLEHLAKYVFLAEAFIAGPRERRMIRDSIFDPELAEPAIGEVHLHFTTD
jgi:hypothetical protein